MVVSLLVIGFIAWAMLGAVEDTIRSARGDAPAGPRRGFRGYLDDRWAALADRHHANREAGLLSGADKWAHKRHLARRKALARAGFKTDEDIERAAVEHRRRLGLIRQGVDPDTEPDEEEGLDAIGLDDLTVDEPLRNNRGQWIPREEPEPSDVQDEPWTPFTEPKENTTMTAGEINSPADVKAFHEQLTASLNATVQNTDTLAEIVATLNNRVADQVADIMATEMAAAGMDQLGMTDAAAAARALIEQQQQIEQALKAIVGAIEANAAAITDAVAAARPGVNTIGRAYAAQLSVADTRQAAGRGNLSRDAYLDSDV